MRIIRRLILSLLATLLGMWVGSGVDAATAARSMPGTVHAAYCYDHDAAMCPRALVSGTCHGNAPPSPFVAASVSVGILPYSMSEPASTTPNLRSVATEAGGARFVAASDGAVTDLVGANPNAVVLGKYPAYVNEGAATGARTFSMSDVAWNAMTPAQQWTRNQQFLDQAITRGSDIRLATPPTASNLTGWYAREIGYLTKQGYTISSDGARMIPPGG